MTSTSVSEAEAWPKWVDEAFDVLDWTEEPSCRFFPARGMPEWVWSMLWQMMRMLHSTLPGPEEGKPGARILGSFVGHQHRLMTDEQAVEDVTNRVAEAWVPVDRQLKEHLDASAYAGLVKQSESWFKKTARPFLKKLERQCRHTESAVGKVTRLALEQNYCEQGEYFEAYAKAIRTPLVDDEGRAWGETSRNATTLYFLMVLYWKQIQKCKTLAEAHGWLRAKFGDAVNPNFDGFKETCRPHGLKLAKPGRPKLLGG